MGTCAVVGVSMGVAIVAFSSIDCRDDLDGEWDELFLQSYESLRRWALDVLDRHPSSSILAHGCARALAARNAIIHNGSRSPANGVVSPPPLHKP